MNLFKKATEAWLLNSLFVLGVLSLGHQTQAQTSTPQKVETYRFTGKRANYSITATPHGAFSLEENTATNKVIDAWIGIGFKSDAPGSGWFGAVIDKLHRFEDWKEVIGGDKEDADQAASALHPFWSGVARFDVQTLDQDGEPYFAYPLYTWSSTPEPYPSINPTPEDNAIRLPADKKSATKEFRVDLGDVDTQSLNFPKTSEAEVTVVGGDFTGQPSPIQVKPPLPPAKVTIHWHWAWEGASGGGTDPTVFTIPASGLMTLENGTDQKPADQFQVGEKFYVSPNQFRRTITKIERLPDGSIKFTSYVDPDDNLDTENGDLQQQIEKIQAAYKETIYTGAQGVKYGLEAYKAVAEFYAYGPFFELGGELVFRAGTKAAELLTASTEARQIAQRLRKVGESTQILIGRVKSQLNLPGQDAEKVAHLQQTLKELEDIAVKCERGSDDLERVATCGERLAKEADEAAKASGEGTVLEPNCFAAGTIVWLADGESKFIEKIAEGDVVLAKDIHTGKISGKKVLRTFTSYTDEILNLSFDNGEHILTTAAHPFYVEKKGFVRAGMLPIGTSIVSRAGPQPKITSIEKKQGRTEVYNFNVEGYHNYFVGQLGLLVHNANFVGTCGFENAPPGSKGTLEHKEAGWEKYLARKQAEGEPPLTEQQWSNKYDASMRNAERGNQAASDYGATLGWQNGEGQCVVEPEEGMFRKLDWGDSVAQKGLEYKNYTSANVSPSGRATSSRSIADEVDLDAKQIANNGWDIRWVFEGKGPNGPLRRLLEQKRIPWKMKDDTVWVAPWVTQLQPLQPF